jgi:hypothetical protein
MTIVAPWAVWMCSDHRLTPAEGQGEINDFSVKQIIMQSADGEVLITYTGMGTVENDIHVSEWLRRMLRNENWNLDQIETLIQHWAAAKWGRSWPLGDVDIGFRWGASAMVNPSLPRSPTSRGRPDRGRSPTS